MSSEAAGIHEDYIVSVPTIFHQLPLSGAEVDSRLEEIVDALALGEEAAKRILHGLRNVTRLAHQRPPTLRTDWALITAPNSGRVDALLTLELYLQTDTSRAQYLADARGEVESSDSTELIRRKVSEHPLAAGPAIAIHDLTLPTTVGGVAEPAAERAVVALFPVDFDKVFEFTLLTQDLGLFDDATEYLLQIVSQVHAVTAISS